MDIGVWMGNNTVGTPAYMGSLATASEDAGFDSLWVSDHVVWPRDYEPVYPYGEGGRYPGDENTPLCEAVTSLAWLSARTERVRLGTCVLVAAQREPWLLAKQLASLDQLNGGRTTIGVGLGWMREEFEVLGASFDDRSARTREMVELLRVAWTTQPVTFDGAYWQGGPLGVLPHPVQQPIPILLGGNAPSALRKVADYADGWCPYGLDVGEFAQGLASIRARAEAQGRDPSAFRTVLWAPLLLADTDQPMVPLHGNAAFLTERLGAYAEAGLDEFVMFNLATPDKIVAQIEDFAGSVLPAAHAASR
jgi:probable F420-dependent oxidoreductase